MCQVQLHCDFSVHALYECVLSVQSKLADGFGMLKTRLLAPDPGITSLSKQGGQIGREVQWVEKREGCVGRPRTPSILLVNSVSTAGKPASP